MEKETYLFCFACGIIGVLLHIFALKIPSAKERSKTANLPFSIKSYLSDDYPAIIASIITVIGCVMVVDEIIGYNPSFMRFIKFGFIFIGYTGSSILISAFGKFDKGINAVVDVKTDKADGK